MSKWITIGFTRDNGQGHIEVELEDNIDVRMNPVTQDGITAEIYKRFNGSATNVRLKLDDIREGRHCS